MRRRQVDPAICAANPIGRTAALELRLEDGEREMLAAIAAEARAGAERETANAGAGVSGVPLRAWRGAPLRARLVAAVAVILALVALSAFTAPGGAVAGWVGEQLGFGEPGGPPSLSQLRAKWTQGTGAEGQPAYVLLVGPAPRGDRYELITYRTRKAPGLRWPANGARCFELDITKARSSGSAGCGVLPVGSHLYAPGVAGNSDPDKELAYLAGRASMAVDSIGLTFKGRPVEVELRPIPEELVERFKLTRPFQFFIAFWDDARRGGELKLVARDATGKVLARRRYEAMNTEPLFRHVCRSVSRSTRNPKALEDCRQVLGPGPW